MSKRFGDQGFWCWATRCWKASLEELQDTSIWPIFRDFQRRFPDHPDDRNTRVYLEYNGHPDRSPPSWVVSWHCSHFEHDSRDDLAELVGFLDVLATLAEHPRHCTALESLHEEKLHVKLYFPRESVCAEIRRCGQELEGKEY